MSVNPIVQQNQIVSQNDPNGIVGKDGFLQLLLIQMQNQDPLNPLDNQEMLSQLAQFSSLEQMSQLNETFSEGKEFSDFLEATRLIGKEVSMLDPTSSKDNPKPLTTKVQAVSFSEEGPVLQLENGFLSSVDSIFAVREPQESQ